MWYKLVKAIDESRHLFLNAVTEPPLHHQPTQVQQMASLQLGDKSLFQSIPSLSKNAKSSNLTGMNTTIKQNFVHKMLFRDTVIVFFTDLSSKSNALPYLSNI